jgi:valyl-tRNA synthetase
MSKSLGNVVDPVDVIEGISLERLHAKLREGNLDPREVQKAIAGQKADFPNGIPECGTDALRFSLCNYTSANRDINLDILRVEGYRKFCNKLWNATRFALIKLGDGFVPRPDTKLTGCESLSERWILHKLNKASSEVNKSLEEKNFMTATNATYWFWIYELCDVYIEIIKPITDADISIEANAIAKRSAQDTLYTCLEAGLKLLHPFMPFVTEELYQRLGRRPGDKIKTIVLASYPIEEPSFNDEQAEHDFDLVFAVIKSARSLMVEYNVTSNAKIYIQTTSPALAILLNSQKQGIVTLTKGVNTAIVLVPGEHPPPGCALSTLTDELYVSLLVKGNVDIDAEAKKFEAKREKSAKSLEILKKKMALPDYKTKVPVDVREANDAKVKQYEAEMEALSRSVENFLKLKD